ncbi:MAG: DNA polymerase III subunit gamma/tau [Sphingomonadaceae bacterium]|nr:DNA polymerase III subunit gamma/tau [Sphingomonadaceae bacterium]
MGLFPDPPSPAPAYRVLARKYRPGDFSALVGQEAMVRTLANALRTGRLAQAWLLTGVRGVGKTSTARIIARCLNCIGPDGSGGPTAEPCGQCLHCRQIAAGEHLDVIEMDAASNTGVDDVREIIEAVRYASVSARYKVYIIDEVHMLSRAAFNALLKTLEEPPPHVKFVLATTEVDKVPATIVSRCQRFDLRRVPVATLEAHFARVCQAEGVAAEPAALALIARAAEGSVRDGLSILDQAIALGAGSVTAEAVRQMLGLADCGRTVRLFQALVEADAQATLAELAQAWARGTEPSAQLRDLLDVVHAVARMKLGAPAEAAWAEADRQIVEALLPRLDFPQIHRLWQLLLKGHDEVARAPEPMDAAEMACLRVVHAAGLPTPEDLARLLEGMPGGSPVDSSPDEEPPARDPTPADFEGLVALFEERREARLARLLTDAVGVVRMGPGCLELAALGTTALPDDFARSLARHLETWTGRPWEVRLSATAPAGVVSLREARVRRAERARADVLGHPAVRRIFDAFPSAELLEVRPGDEGAA